MLRAKRFIGRRRRSLLRVAGVIAGFACIMHVAHRECARMADRPPYEAPNTQNSTNPVNLSGSEEFHATAYCVTGTTKSGVQTAPGLVAADPKVIPLGSMIHVDSPLMGGIYQVLDTGELVKGNIIDIFIPSYERCKDFGRRIVKVKVLRYGFYGQSDSSKPDPKQEK
jgi:3D (Asp-Asp-Asp) domain-containing protein